MYRKFYSENNFEHYVFVRDPVDRTISGFETVTMGQKDEIPNTYGKLQRQKHMNKF